MVSQAEIQKNLYNPLQEIGLSEHEILLYATSLAVGPASIAKLAIDTGVTRPNVYKLMEGLEKHGLVKFSQQKHRKKTFMVEPPTVVVELIRKKREALLSFDHQVVAMMPDLLALYRQGELPTSVKIIENEAQYLKIFDQIIDEENRVSEFFGSTQDFIKFITWEKERDWIRRRVQKNIQMKVLTLPSEDASILQINDPLELRETKILVGMNPFPTSFQLFANKVILWQPQAPLAILITDEYIVKMLKAVFYYIWFKV